MVWFTTQLKPSTIVNPLVFHVRKVHIAPLVKAPAKTDKAKYFLPVDNPKGKVLGFTLYSPNIDTLEDGLVKEGLFQVRVGLKQSIQNPNIKYVQVYLVDLEKEPEDHIVKEFYLTYSVSEIVNSVFTRSGRLILPAGNKDLIIYAGMDWSIESESLSLDYDVKSKNGLLRGTKSRKYIYLAFITEKGIPHITLEPTMIPIKSQVDIVRDLELLFTFGR